MKLDSYELSVQATINLCGYWNQAYAQETKEPVQATINLCGYWNISLKTLILSFVQATINLCGYWNLLGELYARK